MRQVLFLYTELAPYFLACVEELAEKHEVQVHLVRWPVNTEAPFQLRFSDRVQVYDRPQLDNTALLELVARIAPDIVFCSGWVDKGYLRTCRKMRAKGIPTVMCSDTAWRGDARQWAAVAAARLWLRATFSDAWVTGEVQAVYARRLGFPAARIHKGFYSADVQRFAPLAQRLALPDPLPHRFLCVARYIPTKGHQLLCEAFVALCDAGLAEDWELWIAGTGELHEQVVSSAAGRHERIRHLGFVQAADMPAVMRECTVFVLPSTHEPWGVVVHEHACAGFPLLLSTAVGAAERFLVEGVNGLQFAARDAIGLQHAMARLVAAEDDDLRRMGRASHELGMAWSPEAWARTVMNIMEAQHG